MSNAFTPITEEYREKHYPNGYFASLSKKSAEASGYPESTIREFAQQAVMSDSVHFQLAGLSNTAGGKGILTRDYILFENLLELCVIKRSDITGAYLVSLPSTVKVGKRLKTVYNLNAAIFSNHNTSIVTEVQRDTGPQLIAMLTESNPDIDTAEGRILSAAEFSQMRRG